MHDVQFDTNNKITAITMEYMPGKPLNKVWKHLDPSQKLAVAKQLEGLANEMGAMKSSYIGSVDGGKAASDSLDGYQKPRIKREQWTGDHPTDPTCRRIMAKSISSSSNGTSIGSTSTSLLPMATPVWNTATDVAFFWQRVSIRGGGGGGGGGG